MKTILTLIFVFVFGALAVAQDVKTDNKVNTSVNGITLSYSEPTISVFPEIKVYSDKGIARILLFKMDKLKKELAFKTKEGKPKWV
ncbi:hypothetical protein GGR42_002869 [Saonia flava]|uniref:Uncharacterized protein n=1 Tax=Saonia flava TaxID=523696 RepID=A0A846QWN0_9FLAO|nr:hypothetical protein [Saonia flava]NJB72378.1 hypothetical protein [Saonia flava]